MITKEKIINLLPEWLVMLSGLFYISDRYKRLRNAKAKQLIQLRHDACNQDVRISEVLRLEEGTWKRYRYITVKDLVVCDYDESREEYLALLRERYYKLHKKTILDS